MQYTKPASGRFYDYAFQFYFFYKFKFKFLIINKKRNAMSLFYLINIIVAVAVVEAYLPVLYSYTTGNNVQKPYWLQHLISVVFLFPQFL